MNVTRMVQLSLLQNLINNFTFISKDSMTTHKTTSARPTLYQNTAFKATLIKKMRWCSATNPSQHL